MQAYTYQNIAEQCNAQKYATAVEIRRAGSAKLSTIYLAGHLLIRVRVIHQMTFYLWFGR